MPWVEGMTTAITDQKSSNWIAQETRLEPAFGKKWTRNWNLQDISMFQLPFRSLLKSSAVEQQKSIMISLQFPLCFQLYFLFHGLLRAWSKLILITVPQK